MKASMKKMIAMGLVLTMSVSCLAGCGGSDDANNTDTPATSEEGGAGESGTKKTLTDLGGLKVTIGDWYTPENQEVTTDFEKATEKYREEIMSKYNFEIERKNAYSYADMQETYVTQTMAKNPSCSLYFLYQEMVSQPLMKGLMYNLATVPTIDLKEEKWNTMVNELMTVGGGTYGMSAEQEPRGGVFFNKRLLEEAGIDPEEPYDLQANGEWTWKKFEEYCKKLTKDVDNDGTTDQYAMASFSKYYLPSAAANNNAGFIGRDKDGNYVNTTGSKEFLEAMNWAVDLIDKGYIMPKPDGANWDWYKAAFRDADVAMQTAEVYEISAFQQMEDDWGFVMFPYNQDNKDATNKTIPNDNVVCLPSCYSAEEAEKICFAFDLYTETTPGYDYESTWKETYYNQFKDSRAVDETLVMMHDDAHKSISYLPMISDIDYGDFCYSVYAGAETPAKKIDAIKSKWDAKIKDMNSKYSSFKAD